MAQYKLEQQNDVYKLVEWSISVETGEMSDCVSCIFFTTQGLRGIHFGGGLQMEALKELTKQLNINKFIVVCGHNYEYMSSSWMIYENLQALMSSYSNLSIYCCANAIIKDDQTIVGKEKRKLLIWDEKKWVDTKRSQYEIEQTRRKQKCVIM